MVVGERLWTFITSTIGIFTLSPPPDVVDSQAPIAPSLEIVSQPNSASGPSFRPPGVSAKYNFTCKYPAMVGWEPCSTSMNRNCWLRRKSDGKQYDINTNYEDDAPIGITRNYTLKLVPGSFDADGLNFTEAKLFNGQYPGPWLEACWGDTGTSIHWHGIRQNQTMHMDGVNGITQCPIAPKDYFVYKFNVTQYGSSWYHSHYSVQYADGAVGPLTFHGPVSAGFHEAVSPPLIITDWGHNSAFVAVHSRLENKDILLNGRGNVTNYNNSVKNETTINNPYHITFEGPKEGKPCRKYLLRVINTSFDTTFVFSIDNHLLQIVSTDFVPIQPYYNTSVLVGIGQRYNIIVEANPLAYNESSPLPADGNYWIRTYTSPCNSREAQPSKGYERNGILRYDNSSQANPSSQPWQNVSVDCSDETYESLHPIVPWKVKSPVNGPFGEQFNLWRDGISKRPFPLARWTLDYGNKGLDPIRVDYSNLTFFHLDNKKGWDPLWRMVPENYASNDWVYLAIVGLNGAFGAHPIHLHGHDFALLEQAYNKEFDPKTLKLKLENPPRRDVVLMPKDGYVAIAFKADNPGAWLVHCHIAFHISEGLGMQIMERQSDANAIWPKGNSKALTEAERVCKNWSKWYNVESNWAVPPAKCKETKENKKFASKTILASELAKTRDLWKARRRHCKAGEIIDLPQDC